MLYIFNGTEARSVSMLLPEGFKWNGSSIMMRWKNASLTSVFCNVYTTVDESVEWIDTKDRAIIPADNTEIHEFFYSTFSW